MFLRLPQILLLLLLLLATTGAPCVPRGRKYWAQPISALCNVCPPAPPSSLPPSCPVASIMATDEVSASGQGFHRSSSSSSRSSSRRRRSRRSTSSSTSIAALSFLIHFVPTLGVARKTLPRYGCYEKPFRPGGRLGGPSRPPHLESSSQPSTNYHLPHKAACHHCPQPTTMRSDNFHTNACYHTPTAF